jgi:hypothetical protein
MRRAEPSYWFAEGPLIELIIEVGVGTLGSLSSVNTATIGNYPQLEVVPLAVVRN